MIAETREEAGSEMDAARLGEAADPTVIAAHLLTIHIVNNIYSNCM